jgi:hypothetical protein
MRFCLGQEYAGKKDSAKIAHVVQVEDDGHKAWIEVRDQDGVLLDNSWATYAQFIGYWVGADNYLGRFTVNYDVR